jgi:hydrogenase maturation protease
MAGEPSGEVLVAAIGQAAAGDDGVGFAVLEALRAQGLENVDLRSLADPAALLSLLSPGRRAVLIDGVIGGGPSGEVGVYSPEEIAGRTCATLSSHGLDVTAVLALARSLTAPAPPPRVTIVGVAIERPRGLAFALSPSVQAAVPRAAAVVAALLSP